MGSENGASEAWGWDGEGPHWMDSGMIGAHARENWDVCRVSLGGAICKMNTAMDEGGPAKVLELADKGLPPGARCALAMFSSLSGDDLLCVASSALRPSDMGLAPVEACRCWALLAVWLRDEDGNLAAAAGCVGAMGALIDLARNDTGAGDRKRAHVLGEMSLFLCNTMARLSGKGGDAIPALYLFGKAGGMAQGLHMFTMPSKHGL